MPPTTRNRAKSRPQTRSAAPPKPPKPPPRPLSKPAQKRAKRVLGAQPKVKAPAKDDTSSAPAGFYRITAKRANYLTLAKVFEVDAVVYNVFLRMFKPFGPGESLQVNSHTAQRPTSLSKGTEVPDPRHPMWLKEFATLTDEVLAVKPIISRRGNNALNLEAWDDPPALDVWYHAHSKALHKPGRLFYVLQIQLDKVVKIGIGGVTMYRYPGGRIRDYLHLYGYVDPEDDRMGVRVLYILWTPHNRNVEPANSKIHKVEQHLINRIKTNKKYRPVGRGRERISNKAPLSLIRKWVEEVVKTADDELTPLNCRSRAEKKLPRCRVKEVKEKPL
jgi:hypothetical protein